MSAVYRKFCFRGRQNAHSGVWGLSLASVCSVDSTCPVEAQCAPGQVPALSVFVHLKAGGIGVKSRVSWALDVPSYMASWGLEHRTHGVLILKIKDESWENSPHPPYAPAHGSLLTFNSRDFRYWLIFLSLFGDSEFHEGKNHDFPSFFLMVLCWRDSQQTDECMSGWTDERGSTNQSSSVASSLTDNKLLDLTWRHPLRRVCSPL